jgi:hypothetical protein
MEPNINYLVEQRQASFALIKQVSAIFIVMFSSVLVAVEIFYCSGPRNTYLSMWLIIPVIKFHIMVTNRIYKTRRH